MKRQALTTTIGQLRRIANELEKELKEKFKGRLHDPKFAAEHQLTHQINIVNYSPKCSDTWEIEETEDKK